MKQRILLFLMLLMGAGLATLPMATIHAQTKKTNKSAVVRGKKKTTTPKAKAKTTQSATSKSAKTASPVSGGIFEGSRWLRFRLGKCSRDNAS